jgi:hypothetical protein
LHHYERQSVISSSYYLWNSGLAAIVSGYTYFVSGAASSSFHVESTRGKPHLSRQIISNLRIHVELKMAGESIKLLSSSFHLFPDEDGNDGYQSPT